MDKPSPFIAGITGRCPKCGEGAIFDGMLQIAPACDACEASFESADIGDGAAVFGVLIAGAFAVVLLMLMQVAFDPPWWVHIIVQIPFISILTVSLLRLLKGLLFALQFAHGAQQGKLDE
jgi:uncharacterized protein (DUF983 family)